MTKVFYLRFLQFFFFFRLLKMNLSGYTLRARSSIYTKIAYIHSSLVLYKHKPHEGLVNTLLSFIHQIRLFFFLLPKANLRLALRTKIIQEIFTQVLS